MTGRPGQTITGDKNYFDKDFEQALTDSDIRLLRPARKGENERPGAHLFKPLRQTIDRSTRRSRASLTWNDTAAVLLPE
ncbi:MAG: hypothetical protein JWL97_3470 [Gemmatimonadales bacterium]|nr:hypothetical protein [Gemmatimonadales bacterium]